MRNSAVVTFEPNACMRKASIRIEMSSRLYCRPSRFRVWMIFNLLLGSAALVQAQATELPECVQIPSGKVWGLEAPMRPADCAVVEQTPPDFSWPAHGAGGPYRFALTFPNGKTELRNLNHNWIAWPAALAPGAYRWRVTVMQEGMAEPPALASGRFRVSEQAQPFVVPDWRILHARASALAHPRALPRGAEKEALIGAFLNERKEGLQQLLTRANGDVGRGLSPEPPFSPSLTVIQLNTGEETKRIQHAAFAWVVTKNRKYLDHAKRRALSMARWNPRGSTGFKHHDLAAKMVAFTLTLTYDWLYEDLTREERVALLDAIRPRMQDMFGALAGPRGINLVPYNSHGYEIMGKIAAISALLAGDVAEAEQWFAQTVPLHLHSINPWGGEDGGYANGTNYALWDTGDSFTVWHILRWTTGVNVADKVWIRNFGRYLSFFLPPGTPRHAFGDGTELTPGENWPRFGKAYALLAPSPLSRWYATQLLGEDKARLEMLLAPRDAGGVAPFPEGTPNAALFPSIGWSAMHSDLRDRDRVSVYFKSSPYGSHNHSHADQNSFVIHARGRALAIDSGYYDSYHSPHMASWTMQTRAHNAITFDRGQGQPTRTIAAAGKITQFESGALGDIVTGDATQAYAGKLRKAVRSVVYLRPDQVAVFDRLESDTPRRWEWNIHALERMLQDEVGKLMIKNGPVALCVELRASIPIRFMQSDAFPDAPQKNGFANRDMLNQWHGRFESVNQTKSILFAALLSVDCKPGAEIRLQGETKAFATIPGIEAEFTGSQTVLRNKNETSLTDGGGELIPVTIHR